MELWAPRYYIDFKCIADECSHTCCAGWEIDVDDDALERFRALGDEKLLSTLEYTDGTPHFRLCENGNCPHLLESGLCRMIIDHGEEVLCEICREHPRFYNLPTTRAEVGLGASCEEAARIILTSNAYSEFVKIGSLDTDSCEEAEINPLMIRGFIYSILADEKTPYDARLSELYSRYGVSPAIKTDAEWKEVIGSLEYLDPAHRELFLSYSYTADTPKAAEKYSERFLAYLVFRHVSSATTPEEALLLIGFCFFCERLFTHLLRGENAPSLSDAVEAARIISEELEYSDENTDTLAMEFETVLE